MRSKTPQRETPPHKKCCSTGSQTPQTAQAPEVTALQTHLPKTAAPPAAPVQLAALATPATVSAAPPDSAADPKIAPNPLKTKTLRVVHINELPGGGNPAPAVTATDAGRHFEFFLTPPEVKLSSSN